MADTHGRIAIVGGGLAGATCALELRAQGFVGAVHFFDAEAHAPYERPPLSKGVLSGDPITWIGGSRAITDAGIEMRPAAVRLDAHEQIVEDHDGCCVAYDRLMIATGRRARRLALLETVRCPVLTLRTYGDACRLRHHAHPKSHVLIIGAGLIGMEVSASLAHRCASVTLIEAGDRPLARCVPSPIADLASKALDAKNVDLRLGTTITGASGDRICLSDGSELTPDLIVCAIGSIPNDDLAREAGLEVDEGVVVNPRLHTSAQSVFAAGDVVAMRLSGGTVRFENYQAADLQGRIAARNMLGANAHWQAPNWFWSNQGNLTIEGVGDPMGDEQTVHTLSDSSVFVEILSDGAVVGAFGGGGRKALREVRRAQQRIAERLAAMSGDQSRPLTCV